MSRGTFLWILHCFRNSSYFSTYLFSWNTLSSNTCKGKTNPSFVNRCQVSFKLTGADEHPFWTIRCILIFISYVIMKTNTNRSLPKTHETCQFCVRRKYYPYERCQYTSVHKWKYPALIVGNSIWKDSFISILSGFLMGCREGFSLKKNNFLIGAYCHMII